MYHGMKFPKFDRITPPPGILNACTYAALNSCRNTRQPARQLSNAVRATKQNPETATTPLSPREPDPLSTTTDPRDPADRTPVPGPCLPDNPGLHHRSPSTPRRQRRRPGSEECVFDPCTGIPETSPPLARFNSCHVLLAPHDAGKIAETSDVMTLEGDPC
jgi:hypothetical protein